MTGARPTQWGSKDEQVPREASIRFRRERDGAHEMDDPYIEVGVEHSVRVTSAEIEVARVSRVTRGL